MEKKQVIVVGAGAAGIGATHALRKAGIDVLCLEKQDHVAGRAFSYLKDGYIIEPGAVAVEPQWENSRRLLVETGLINQYHFPKRMRAGFWRHGRWNLAGIGSIRDQIRWLPDTARFRGMPLRTIPQAVGFIKGIASEFSNIESEKYHRQDYSDLNYLNDETIAEYANSHGGPLADNYVANPLMSFAVGGDTRDIAISHMVGLGYDIYQGMSSGMGSSFIGAMERGLSSYLTAAYELDKDAYKLGCPVDRIVIEDGKTLGVEVDGELIESEYVICATTVGAARKLIPNATQAMIDMWDAVKYSRFYNIAVGNRSKFVPDGMIIGAFPATDPMPYFRSVFVASNHTTYAAPPGGEIVQVLTSYSHDELFTSMSPEERREFLLTEVRRIFPKLPPEPEIFEIVRLDEGISLDPPGQMRAVYDFLDNHIDEVKGLDFAGEFMFPVASTEGAQITALQAVDRVMAKIGVKASTSA